MVHGFGTTVTTESGVRTRHEALRAPLGEKGELVITRPYPYLARTVWGDGAHVGAAVESFNADWRGDHLRTRVGLLRREFLRQA